MRKREKRRRDNEGIENEEEKTKKKRFIGNKTLQGKEIEFKKEIGVDDVEMI